MALYPLTEESLMLVLPWRNAPAVRLNMFHNNIISEAEHRAWFAHLQHNNTARWFIHQSAGIDDGVVYFTEIDWQKLNTLWGFYLSPEAKPGSGMSLGMAGLDMAFDELKLETVYARVLPSNEKSIRLHLKLGFELLDSPKISETQQFRAFMLTKTRWQQCRASILEKVPQAAAHDKGALK